MKRLKGVFVVGMVALSLSAVTGVTPIGESFIGAEKAEAAANLPGLNAPYYSQAKYGRYYRNDVKTIQRLLNIHRKWFGLSKLDEDGYFGNLTTAAVKQYQSWHRLTPDGVVGINTWNKLRYEW